ncbi:MAG: FecR domain-containing protein [Gammaproteobacteria bacterium]|nr:FecR domain-containing protein [Gammaproteobacteria bacterium]MDE0414551.1 FecR domain-containing protein [Gammaproteobacteria bacterium]
MNDAGIRSLLESAGPRAQAPRDVEERVYAAMHRTWLELPDNAGRSARKRAAALGALALVLAGAGIFVWRLQTGAAPPVAEITYATGGYAISQQGSDLPQFLTAGAALHTFDEGRLLVRMGERLTLRLDAGAHVEVQSGSRLMLRQGRLFVDSGNQHIEVRTPSGLRVENLGTQFEIQVGDEEVRVAVRQGELRMEAGGVVRSAAARDGAGAILAFEGLELRSEEVLSSTGGYWEWIHLAQPPFVLESSSVLDFLEWAARECGLELAFGSEAVKQRASAVTLHGPPIPATLVSRDHISSILETTASFRIAPSEKHRLLIDFWR